MPTPPTASLESDLTALLVDLAPLTADTFEGPAAKVALRRLVGLTIRLHGMIAPLAAAFARPVAKAPATPVDLAPVRAALAAIASSGARQERHEHVVLLAAPGMVDAIDALSAEQDRAANEIGGLTAKLAESEDTRRAHVHARDMAESDARNLLVRAEKAEAEVDAWQSATACATPADVRVLAHDRLSRALGSVIGPPYNGQEVTDAMLAALRGDGAVVLPTTRPTPTPDAEDDVALARDLVNDIAGRGVGWGNWTMAGTDEQVAVTAGIAAVVRPAIRAAWSQADKLREDATACSRPSAVVKVLGEWRARAEKSEDERDTARKERDEARAKAAVSDAAAYRANRDHDERMSELRAIAAHLNCGQSVDAVRGAVDALRARLATLEARPVGAEPIEATGQARAVTSPPDMLDVARDIHACATSWAPDACIIGNVRAGDIARVASYVLSSLHPEPPRVEWTRDGNDETASMGRCRLRVGRNHGGGAWWSVSVAGFVGGIPCGGESPDPVAAKSAAITFALSLNGATLARTLTEEAIEAYRRAAVAEYLTGSPSTPIGARRAAVVDLQEAHDALRVTLPAPAPGAARAGAVDLTRAVERLLWNSIDDAEGAHDDEDSDDPCPLCFAWRALGHGERWPGSSAAGGVLTAAIDAGVAVKLREARDACWDSPDPAVVVLGHAVNDMLLRFPTAPKPPGDEGPRVDAEGLRLLARSWRRRAESRADDADRTGYSDGEAAAATACADALDRLCGFTSAPCEAEECCPPPVEPAAGRFVVVRADDVPEGAMAEWYRRRGDAEIWCRHSNSGTAGFEPTSRAEALKSWPALDGTWSAVIDTQPAPSQPGTRAHCVCCTPMLSADGGPSDEELIALAGKQGSDDRTIATFARAVLARWGGGEVLTVERMAEAMRSRVGDAEWMGREDLTDDEEARILMRHLGRVTLPAVDREALEWARKVCEAERDDVTSDGDRRRAAASVTALDAALRSLPSAAARADDGIAIVRKIREYVTTLMALAADDENARGWRDVIEFIDRTCGAVDSVVAARAVPDDRDLKPATDDEITAAYVYAEERSETTINAAGFRAVYDLGVARGFGLNASPTAWGVEVTTADGGWQMLALDFREADCDAMLGRTRDGFGPHGVKVRKVSLYRRGAQ